MISLPEEGDLAWLFGAPVVIADPAAQWGFSAIRMHAVRGDEALEVEVHPAAGTVRVAWRLGDRPLVDLPLRRVRAIAIEADGEAETETRAMIVSFEGALGVGPARVQLAPEFRLFWGVERW